MSEQIHRLADSTFLLSLISPLTRDYDCEDGDYPELEVPGLNSNDSTEVKRRIIQQYIVPEFELWTPECKTILKDSLQYYLNIPSPKDRYGDALFQRLFDGGNFAFPDPDDTREFFVWVWEELFGPEDYHLNDLSNFEEIDILRSKGFYKLHINQ